MKMLGLIGGMSWESTAVYYKILNEIARERLGGLASARLMLWSFDFAPVARLQAEGKWAELAALMADAGRRLQAGGAEAILICANTMHKVSASVEEAVSIPMIHIADAAAIEIERAGCTRPLLLATRFVMEQDFYKDRLKEKLGFEAPVPPEVDRKALHRMIFEELCQGIVHPASKDRLLKIVSSARADQGIDGVILGCTEFGLLINQDDLDIPVFDTASLHAKAAMDFALAAEATSK